MPDPGRDTNRPQSDKWQSQVPWSECLQCYQQSKQVVVAGCCRYFNSVRPEINVWGRMREMWEMQQILIISLNDNLSFFLKKQTVAGGWENYRIIRPVLFISQQERDNTVTVKSPWPCWCGGWLGGFSILLVTCLIIIHCVTSQCSVWQIIGNIVGGSQPAIPSRSPDCSHGWVLSCQDQLWVHHYITTSLHPYEGPPPPSLPPSLPVHR